MLRWYKVYDFEKHGVEPQRINTARTVDIEGTRLCMTRTEEGYFALEDRCPHAGARFGMGGYCEDNLLVCPVHRYKFNVKTGRGLQGDFVNTFNTETREDGVYVALEKKWWQLF
jgi:nitrite reductase/ring-hydroxylating ferredoxin subunit